MKNTHFSGFKTAHTRISFSKGKVQNHSKTRSGSRPTPARTSVGDAKILHLRTEKLREQRRRRENFAFANQKTARAASAFGRRT